MDTANRDARREALTEKIENAQATLRRAAADKEALSEVVQADSGKHELKLDRGERIGVFAQVQGHLTAYHDLYLRLPDY